MSKIDWQPIHTAPRDGTDVLLFDTNLGIFEACYISCKIFDTAHGLDVEGGIWLCIDDTFQLEVEEFPNSEYGDGTVTHWAPLDELHPHTEGNKNV